METKNRTITLTDRAPVSITEEDWPVIAVARGDSWGNSGDYGQHEQELAQAQLDEYTLRVRRHGDGRAIVYGVLTAAPAWTGSEDWRGGELLDDDTDIASTIRRVGEDGGLPDVIIRECIADLPTETI